MNSTLCTWWDEWMRELLAKWLVVCLSSWAVSFLPPRRLFPWPRGLTDQERECDQEVGRLTPTKSLSLSLFPLLCSREPESLSSSLFCSSQALMPIVAALLRQGHFVYRVFLQTWSWIVCLLKGQGTAPKSQQFQTVLCIFQDCPHDLFLLGPSPGLSWGKTLAPSGVLNCFLSFSLISPACFLSFKNFTSFCLFAYQ